MTGRSELSSLNSARSPHFRNIKRVRASHLKRMGVRCKAGKVLVADIGGTNARFLLWDVAENSHEKRTYATADFPTFESCMQALMEQLSVTEVDAACFAVAGVVKDGCCHMTNTGWSIDSKILESQFPIRRVELMNDFEAIGHGIFELDAGDLITLHGGTRNPTGPIAVVGPGTGLGEAILLWNSHSRRYDIHATEGSHADFAARGEIQHELALWVEKSLTQCEVEHVCSGPGLIRIYDFLRSRCTESLPTLNAFEITADARSKSCPICVQAVDIFLEILGGEAANLGLKCLATGGVYIAGGIPSKMRDLVTSGSLLESFLCAGSKFSAVRASFPLYVVLNQDVGLVGAKAVAVQLLDGVAH